MLYLALGFRQFSHFYNAVMQALRAQICHAHAKRDWWRGESARELSASEAARVALELGLVGSHRHVFGVMAWFAVLGPVGAIGYRLAALLNDRWGSVARTPRQMHTAGLRSAHSKSSTGCQFA